MSATLSEIMTRIPHVFVGGDAGDLSAVIHFKFSGAEAGEWNAVIKDGLCAVAQGLPRQQPSITLVADSADFCQIARGELDAAAAVMQGRMKVSGDLGTAMKLIPLFHTP
jgi:putative sterol carrier protein